MFSDLVGSTALSARMDPEDLRDVISAYQKCVAETMQRFGGFVAKASSPYSEAVPLTARLSLIRKSPRSCCDGGGRVGAARLPDVSSHDT